MASDSVTVILQTSPLLSKATSGSSSQARKESTSPNSVVDVSANVLSNTVDTVSISLLSRQSAADAKNNEAVSEGVRKNKTKEDESKSVSSDLKSGVTAKVQFVYDLKGELSVRYLDTANNLIYQVPSELMLQIREDALKSEATVDTKA